MRDFGYDVSDYCDIDPLFGSLADFDALLHAAHAAGLKSHPGFRAEPHLRPASLVPGEPLVQSDREAGLVRLARPASRMAPPQQLGKRVRRPGLDVRRLTGQYYYHAYLKEQPDLNWRNPEVVARDVRRAPLLVRSRRRRVPGRRDPSSPRGRGVPGQPAQPRLATGMPPNERWLQIRTVDQPDIHASIKRMRQVADEYPDRVMIGEAYLPIDQLMAYYGADLTGFHLPFNFHLISTAWQPGLHRLPDRGL